MPEPSPTIGETFAGHTIEALLGRGGMGAVYLATHERLERKVALKVVAPELALDEEFRSRFLRESQLAASVDHPNVIPIYDADEANGVLYLAMRYVDGPSLRTLLRERGSLSPAETRRIAEQIGGALDAAHRAGLVHRDVKPGNILLAEGEDHAYLCDFGLARRTSTEGVTRTGSFLGTVDYCSPEQIRGEPLDGRADVYSLGCVLFHCLAGEAPYVRETDVAVLHAHVNDPPPTLSNLRPDLPVTLDDVLARATAKDAASRYETAGALAEAFGAALEGASSTRRAPRIGAGARSGRRQRPGRRVVAALAAVIALGLVAAAVVATRSSDPAPAPADPTAASLRTFVDRIENLLEQSSAGRTEIGTALEAGFDCRISPREAGERIASVADNRQSILGQLGNLQTPTQQADDAVTQLQRGLQESIEADRHYRDGFFRLGPRAGCPLPPSREFTLARRSDTRASVAKRRFVATFDPLAERFHRRSWRAEEI